MNAIVTTMVISMNGRKRRVISGVLIYTMTNSARSRILGRSRTPGIGFLLDITIAWKRMRVRIVSISTMAMHGALTSTMMMSATSITTAETTGSGMNKAL